MIVTQAFYISTGRKNAMHTLRFARSMGGVGVFDSYVRNLAVSVETAQDKATAWVEAFRQRVGEQPNFEITLDLEPEYDIRLRRGKLSARDTACIEMIEAGVLPFGKHQGKKIEDAPDSWILWASDLLTKQGETLQPVMAVLASAALGVALEKGLIAKRDAQRAEQAEQDALSRHVGEVGQRMIFEGEIVAVFVKQPDGYSDGYTLTKVRCGNDLVVFYNNQMGQKGDHIKFKATVKAHKEYKGAKSTQVNRPKKL